MTGFVFDPIKNGFLLNRLNFETGQYSAALVTRLPEPGFEAFHQIETVQGGSYEPIVLEGLSLGANSRFITFNNPQWTALWSSDGSPIVGMVVSLMRDVLPTGDDIPISFCQFNYPIVPPAIPENAIDLLVPIPPTGILEVI